MYDIFLKDWFNALKTKVNCRLRANYKKYKALEVKSVEIIRDDQTTWLSSILDKNIHTNIVIDRVLVDEKPGVTTKRLVTNPEEVKKAVDNDFANMFRKRNTQLNTLIPFWQHIYELIGKFKEVMEVTTKNITLKEWNNIVKDLNEKSAAGLFSINYKII
ncbi:hypothetical protein RhiirA5_435500 [Rhizophagus irregularis]|uniref:Uncharacterized protein n=1 Tax=Rhizophagus irregularis TaxID=588596 RepID=A0A2I1FHI5_9GLOM|nr:hypothetical protein RhiirA5_435500 [Rhizophagus irregularis]PKY33831.1 hypothetical protein RhiirB3_453075 [Rhizophagus irregularis]CAB5092773.1 unnamed protein product [Rhizophagus irregularis]